MDILIVEDDPKIAALIESGLQRNGFAVEQVNNGEDGLRLALSKEYHLAIVDIMLPRLDGLSLVEQLRSAKRTFPVLILSAKRTVDDRVRGLEMGGDDYLVKPFAFAELMARVNALCRRVSPKPTATHLNLGDLSVDLIKREVARTGRRIELQPREFALLEYLLRHAGEVVSKTMIMREVWDYDFDPETNIVEARVCRLRDKIDKDGERKLIHTIRGVGYVLREVS